MTRLSEMAEFLENFEHPEPEDGPFFAVRAAFFERWPDASEEEWEQAHAAVDATLQLDMDEVQAGIYASKDQMK